MEPPNCDVGIDAPISEMDRHVLSLIRAGDGDTWNDVVVSYHGRLLSFAIRQVDQPATAEDIVQEAFVSFLKRLERFRQECDIETFLFQILRRRIVDYYRTKGKHIQIYACGTAEETSRKATSVGEGTFQIASGATGLEQHEQLVEYERLLSQAIRVVSSRLRKKKKFRDLKIAEGTLYASWSNGAMAELLECKPNEVAVVKHRLITRLAAAVQEISPDQDDCGAALPEELLVTVWDRLRPSCPKRTTLGKYLLRLLPNDWRSYVDFHVERIRCQFCLANIDELSAVSADAKRASSERIFQSTIGFLRSSAG